MICVVRLGPGEGLRIGTVRGPPRGLPKSRWGELFDVWLPELSPSQALVSKWLQANSDAERRRFARRFRSELKAPGPARLLDLLAAMSHGADFSIGCYCEHESQCHRSVLRAVLRERGGKVSAD